LENMPFEPKSRRDDTYFPNAQFMLSDFSSGNMNIMQIMHH